ncbi:histidine kinase [Blastococcus sp. HT6-30]|uniref:sensor histidine kinase n=1 Tax=Blastococcus sp. HT6-30 TaxID=3144843 RepID=UPI00321A484A
MAHPPVRTALPWLVPVGAAAAVVAAFVLHAQVSAVRADVAEIYLADVWASLLCPVVGAWFLSRGGARPVGGLLLLAGCLSLAALGTGLANLDALDGALGPVGTLSAWITAWAWTPYLLLPTVLPLVYPGGRPASAAARAVAMAALVLTGLITLGSAIAPGPVNEATDVGNPLGIASLPLIGEVGGALITVVVLVLAPLTVVVLAVERVRRPRPGGTAALVGSAAFVLATFAFGQLSYPWPDVATAAGLSVLPLAIVVDTQAHSVREAERAEQRRMRAAREEERRRIRQELHDGVAPELAGLSLQLEGLTAEVDDAQQAALAQAGRRLRESAVEVRRIVDGLGPSAVDQLGLVGALRVHADRVAGGGAVVRAGDLPDLPAGTEVTAYRIGCEALTNAVRHAGAARIEVDLRADAGSLRLTVTDDGVGGVEQRPGGLGLHGMVSRAEESGGRCHVRARDGGGTVVEAELPLSPGEERPG